MPIVIEQLTHRYSGNGPLAYAAVQDVSLTIEEGVFWGIIGHTGSGKTTLIQHLNGLLLPTSGSVKVDGLDTREKKERKRIRSLVGMVFQYPEYQLFEETVYKDIAFGPKNMGLDDAEIERRVRSAMGIVGLDYESFREKSPFDLSGGEKRRAALCGILAMEPKYLVLDEPMAGLDPKGRASVVTLLKTLQQERGCTIVMVSHSMDDVARSADRIAVLQQGSLVMADTPERVFSQSERLHQMGLTLPQATELAGRLSGRGLPIPEGVYRMETLSKAIRTIYRERSARE